MNSLDLIRDMQHEQRIRRLGRACASAHAGGDHDAAMTHWEQLREAIAERSPSQVARMEARMAQRARRQIKSALMLAFLHGWLPAFAVTAAFQVLSLRSV
ncbi:hypothetical protein GCM10007862_07160 [Dyella lipolytica]|uniref:Uncharacterized protein n=1 Tax=Dyella lipolytica TaxID=1867835 RepID=A0ABW8J0H6_9GAMM|nr:hypothetical protein [Dyella lipolytica]GLQ45665.1 hypothetical protein GCM10007862_07160 [Dyella lipolytica]